MSQGRRGDPGVQTGNLASVGFGAEQTLVHVLDLSFATFELVA